MGYSLFRYLIVKKDSTQFRPDLRKIKRKRKKEKETLKKRKRLVHIEAALLETFPSPLPLRELS